MNRIISGLPLLGTLIPEESQRPSEDCLDAIQLIYMRALEALTAFTTHEFKRFDALVGDQACQIRALKISLIASKRFDSTIVEIQENLKKIKKFKEDLIKLDTDKTNDKDLKKLKEEMTEIGKKIHTKKPSKKEPQNMSEMALIKTSEEIDFLKNQLTVYQTEKLKSEEKYTLLKNGILNDAKTIEVKVCEDALFLIQAFFLTLCKREKAEQEKGVYLVRESLDPNHLMIKTEYKRNPLKNNGADLLDRAKQYIANKSIVFVQEQADVLDCPYKGFLNPILISSKGRHELSFFYMTRVIFESALKNYIPVLLKIRNIHDDPTQLKSFVFKKLFPNNINKDISCIVIEAFSNKSSQELLSSSFEKELSKVGGNIIEIVDLNAAQHSQYTDVRDFIDNKGVTNIPNLTPEINQKKVEAESKGFSCENPAMCCIEHVFCDVIGKQMGEYDE